MANENTDKFENEIAELKASLKAAQDELAKADKAKYEEKIAALTAQVQAFEQKEAEHKNQLDAMTNQVTEATAKIDELNQSKATLEKELADIKAETVKANRVSELVSGGIDKAEATKTVEKFAFLNDEQFKAVAELAIAAANAAGKMDKEMKKKMKKEMEDDKDDSYASDDNVDNADETLIDKAKANKDKEPDLSGGVDDKEAARAAFVERVSMLMNRKRTAVESK